MKIAVFLDVTPCSLLSIYLTTRRHITKTSSLYWYCRQTPKSRNLQQLCY